MRIWRQAGMKDRPCSDAFCGVVRAYAVPSIFAEKLIQVLMNSKITRPASDRNTCRKLRNFHVVANTPRLGYCVAVLTHALQVQLDSFPDSLLGLFNGRAGSNASW